MAFSICPSACAQGVGGAPPLRPPRRSANYSPTIWDDRFIQSLTIDFKGKNHADQIGKFKMEVRHLFANVEVRHQLSLVDNLQQLGVAYHFEEEIKNAMTTIFKSKDVKKHIGDNLYAVSLLFRLLREHGFQISPDVFNSFKDEEGNFKADLRSDIRGILSLHEASFLAIEGENQMDEATDFASRCLRDVISNANGFHLNPALKEQVSRALELPLHWRMKRLHARWFIDQYERKDYMNPSLLKFAKLDFNMVQGVHKRELKELSMWWSNLGLSKSLRFARDRLVENYLWTVGWAFEPKFWRTREATTKINCLITVIDDVYDVYGTLEELKIFTVAVNKWDANAIEQLPDYMKICYMALYNTTHDIAYKAFKLKGVEVLPCLKRSWGDLCKAYLIEANWYHNGYKPTLKEYLDNAWISISGHVILTHAYSTSEDLTKEAVDNYDFYPDIVYHSSMILRLCNDLATSTAELERGDVSKSIQCYMYESEASEAMAREYITNMIASTWKRLNGDRMVNSILKESLKNVALNLPRIAQCIYQNGDGYGQPNRDTKDVIASLLFEPISL